MKSEMMNGGATLDEGAIVHGERSRHPILAAVGGYAVAPTDPTLEDVYFEIEARRGDAGGVEVRICDDGPGIPADVRPRLFEPFFTTKGPGVGSGLGLHIAHQVVARHGGRLEVDSGPGRTCFLIALPEVPSRDATPGSG